MSMSKTINEKLVYFNDEHALISYIKSHKPIKTTRFCVGNGIDYFIRKDKQLSRSTKWEYDLLNPITKKLILNRKDFPHIFPKTLDLDDLKKLDNDLSKIPRGRRPRQSSSRRT